MGGTRERKVSQFVLEALDLPEGRGAARSARRRSRSSSATRRRRDQAGVELAAAPPTPSCCGEPPAGGRLPDLPAQVPLRPPAARPAPAAPRGRLRQHAPRGGRVLPAPAGGGQLHLARGLPRARSTTPWRNEGFLTREHEEQRKRAGRRGADALLSRGGGLGAEAHRRGEGVRLHAGPDRVRGRFDRVDETPDGRRHRRLQDERGHRARRTPISARARASSSRCTRWRSTR